MRIVLIALVLLAAACGSDTEVGSPELLGFTEKPGSDLGAATPTPPPAEATPVAAAPEVTPAPTQRPAATPVPAATFTITINSDTAPAKFDPADARVPKGTVVTWTNRDGKPRSVVADAGAFDSGPIAAGASWSYTANTPGAFPYHDGTRPYAVASLEVT